ncbi:MAG: aminodeoxychorismate synthase, component I, partial [Planctomycetaceae bacterium]
MSDSRLPLVEELESPPDASAALRAFADLPDVLLLESSLRRDHVGRYSFLTADPFERFVIPRIAFGDDPFHELRQRLRSFPTQTLPDLPPFQGGAAGLLSYELGGAWERVPVASLDEFSLPHLHVGFYDWVIAWDHAANRAWVISHGYPETDSTRRYERAAARLRNVR